MPRIQQDQSTPKKPDSKPHSTPAKPVRGHSNFLRPYVEEISRATKSEAINLYHHVAACTALGAFLTRSSTRLVINAGIPPYWTNNWTLFVGPSGSGKSTAIVCASTVLNAVDRKLNPASDGLGICAPTDGSPEGLMRYLQGRQLKQEEGPSTIFVQAEFAQFLSKMEKRYNQGLKDTLKEYYDAEDRDYTSMLSRSAFAIRQPRVSMLGGITPSQLRLHSSEEDWLGGFFSRCFILSLDTKFSGIPPTIPPEVQYGLALKLRSVLKVWTKAQEKLARKNKKKKRKPMPIAEGLEDLIRGLIPSQRESTAAIALNRATLHLLKFAAIEQVDEDPECPEIRRGAIERAGAIVQVWAKGLPDIVDECFTRSRADFEGDRLSKRILAYIQKNALPGASGGDSKRPELRVRHILRRACADAQKLDQALYTLSQMDAIERFETQPHGARWVRLLDIPTDEDAPRPPPLAKVLDFPTGEKDRR